jgi:hypothetical protein
MRRGSRVPLPDIWSRRRDQPGTAVGPRVADGREPAPCGTPGKDDPARCCIREPGHSGRHKYRHINGLMTFLWEWAGGRATATGPRLLTREVGPTCHSRPLRRGY